MTTKTKLRYRILWEGKLVRSPENLHAHYIYRPIFELIKAKEARKALRETWTKAAGYPIQTENQWGLYRIGAPKHIVEADEVPAYLYSSAMKRPYLTEFDRMLIRNQTTTGAFRMLDYRWKCLIKAIKKAL